MAATREAGAYVDVDSGGRKVAMDGALAHKHKFSNYVADDAALEVSLLPDEGYVYVTTSGSGGTVKLNLPDVSVARGRVYTVVFTKVTSNLTVGYTGTSTGDATVSASDRYTYTSDGDNWIVT